ncbi:MAG: LytTR family DNA-binding domain-containing protein [Bacteroidales bacterium]|nr:LytTR family DNA-binding domain-containing protein [Bacteroidales bacterium]MCF8456925.1 LytTR family DNA-binding domain-containing protein [Bacteroidales bacterium]
MKRYQALIVDDEKKLRTSLELLLAKVCPEINICGSADSANKAREMLKSCEVDFIFLDISMPKEDGFAFLRSISKENYAVIFTTAYEEYAIQAIRASAIDYLLKPINANELKGAVAKAILHHEERRSKTEAKEIYRESLENLQELMKSGQEKITKITVPDQFGFRVVNVDDLMYLEADSNYTNLHFQGQNKIVASRSLGEFEKILLNPEFFKIHRSTIINLNFLKAYSSYEGDFAVLTDGTELSISRRKLNEFRDAITHFSKSVR